MIATSPISPTLNSFRLHEDEAFIAVSMYARRLKPHPSTKSSWRVGYSDASAHRIISDLSAFIGHRETTKHRILAAGDLNMFYRATGWQLSLPERDLVRLAAMLEDAATCNACMESPYGAILGTAELVDCVEESDDHTFTRPYGWVFSRPRPLRKPIPARGTLRLWTVPPAIARRLQ